MLLTWAHEHALAHRRLSLGTLLTLSSRTKSNEPRDVIGRAPIHALLPLLGCLSVRDKSPRVTGVEIRPIQALAYPYVHSMTIVITTLRSWENVFASWLMYYYYKSNQETERPNALESNSF